MLHNRLYFFVFTQTKYMVKYSNTYCISTTLLGKKKLSGLKCAFFLWQHWERLEKLINQIQWWLPGILKCHLAFNFMPCLAKVLNKANKCCSNFFYKMLWLFAKTRYPSLLFRPIRLEICQLWAYARDLEGKSSCVRKAFWKRLRKRDLLFPRNAQKITHRHGHAPFLSLSSLFFALAFSQWTSERQEDKYSET